jgi:hypothetical protein
MITFNFDVLAKPGNHLPTRQPDRDGIKLWKMMHEEAIGRLGLVIDGYENTEHLEYWLKSEDIRAATYEQLDLPPEGDPVLKADKIQLYMSIWGRADWYVDNDPKVAVELLRLGIPTLMAVTPYVVRPEWSPTTPVKPRDWDTLVEEITKQKIDSTEKTWKRGQE